VEDFTREVLMHADSQFWKGVIVSYEKYLHIAEGGVSSLISRQQSVLTVEILLPPLLASKVGLKSYKLIKIDSNTEEMSLMDEYTHGISSQMILGMPFSNIS
jgi:hypothetical protein